MGLLIALAIVAVLGIPVAVIMLLIGQARLRERVTALERALSVVRSVQAAVPVPSGPVTDAAAPVDAAPAVEAAVAPAVAAPGPWETAAIADTAAPGTRQDYPVVMRADRVAALVRWVRANWVYAVSALSLALAGIFFVQYGIENGLLSPRLRVMMALVFGVTLIGAGEWIRRRWGDGAASHSAYLPSTFSGAGLVSMFAGILAARQLYGLIGPETAMAGLVAVALGAVVLGWLHGPFLVAIGLIGATAAPFAVGGSSNSVTWLFAYFGLIAMVGLAVDAWRRWAWVSVLALVLAIAAGWLLHAASGGEAPAFALLLGALAVMAIAVPVWQLWPAHDGPTVTGALMSRGMSGWPSFPVRLAAGAMLAASAILMLLATRGPGESLLVFALLALLTVAVALWADRAPALADLAALPALAFLGRLAQEAVEGGPLAREFMSAAMALREPETGAPMTVTILLGLVLAGTLAAAWRSLRDTAHPVPWAAGACLFAPVAALLIELFWGPSAVMGAYPWALHVTGLAAIMTGLAARYAGTDGADRRRVAYATLSALSLVALALFLILSTGALTLALAVLVVVAAWLDRRFGLAEMGWYIQAGVLVLGWRLTVDPGLDWAFATGWGQMALAFAGAIAGMVAAHGLLRGRDRKGAEVFLESGIAAYAAIFANVVITRMIDDRLPGDFVISYWSLGLNALPWLVVMLAQLYRMQLGGWMRWLRGAIAVVAGVFGFGGLLAAIIPASPLIGLLGTPERLVRGPLVLDTLLVAYGLPAALLVLAVWRMPWLHRWVRLPLMGAGVGLGALYAGLEIRRYWRGDDLAVPGVTQPELYSYTVAMLLAGAVLLYQAIARRSGGLRRVAMAVIALTIAKVFLIDASGLSGLTRVFSFLALGLSLAGLAWLNRWAADRQGGGAPSE